VAILYVATKGLLDDIPTPRVKEFEAQFARFLDMQRGDLMKKLATTKVLDDDAAAGLETAANEFRQTFVS
jgi:F-type H+-transporting ATPase subunit alpha